MILTATLQYQKFPQIFQKPTRISIKVNGAGGPLLLIAKEQGEIQNAPADGLSLDSVGTNPPNQPWSDWWQGEFWYILVPLATGLTSITFSFEILTT
jgi:hypothetical protein